MKTLLSCAQGHRWESEDGATPCPLCGEEALFAVDDAAPLNPTPSHQPVTRSFLEPRREELGAGHDSVSADLDAATVSAPASRIYAPATLPSIPGYEVICELGRGGSGVVYQARQVRLNRIVALKMLLAGAHAGPQEQARFRNEAEAVARLQHPSFVQIYEIGDQDNRTYLALEFLAGGSLTKQLQQQLFAGRKAATLLEELARAMHVAHERGIVHRDLKPGNILFTEAGHAKITDFGLARVDAVAGIADGEQEVSALTASGMLIGTPSYMAPEQAAGLPKLIGPRTDVYALGAILYTMLTGRPPFRAATALETARQVLEEEPVPPGRLQPKLARDIETICLKCLQKQPEKRYLSARALANDLKRFLEGEPIRARPVRLWERGWKWARRRPAASLLLLVLGLGTIGLLGGSLWFTRELRRERDIAREREEAARANLYLANMTLVPRLYEESNLSRVQALLDALRPRDDKDPDLRGFEWHYYRRLCRSDLLTITRNVPAITSLVLSLDGSRFITVGITPTNPADPGEVAVWDAKTYQLVLTLQGHKAAVGAAKFSPDGKWIALGTCDNQVRVHDATTGNLVRTLLGHSNWIGSLDFTPDGRSLICASGGPKATGDFGGEVHLWDVATWKAQRKLTGAFGGMAVSRDGKRLALATFALNQTAELSLWDLPTWKKLHSFPSQTGFVSSLAFSSDGSRLLSSNGDIVEMQRPANIQVWDVHSGKEVQTLSGHGGTIFHVTWSPDGQRIISSGADRTIRFWDATSGQELSVLRGHRGMVGAVEMSLDSRRLFSAGGEMFAAPQSATGEIKVWDLTRGQKAQQFKAHPNTAANLAFSPDGKLLATVSGDPFRPNKAGEVAVWDADTGVRVRGFAGHRAGAAGVSFSPDGGRLATAGGEPFQPGELKVWDVATGKLIFDLASHADRVQKALYSRDGRTLVSASWDRTIRIWDAESGAILKTLTGHTQPVIGLALSPDGKLLASSSVDILNLAGTSQVKVWDLAAGTEVADLGPGHSVVQCVAFSPDSTRVALARADRTVALCEARSGRQLDSYVGHGGQVTSVTFSPDGRRLASAGQDGVVRIWIPGSGHDVLTLKPGTGPIVNLFFSPDGDRLAASHWDGTISLWDASPVEEPSEVLSVSPASADPPQPVLLPTQLMPVPEK